MVFAPSRCRQLPDGSTVSVRLLHTKQKCRRPLSRPFSCSTLPALQCTAPCCGCVARVPRFGGKLRVASARHILGSRPNHIWRLSTDPARRRDAGHSLGSPSLVRPWRKQQCYGHARELVGRQWLGQTPSFLLPNHYQRCQIPGRAQLRHYGPTRHGRLEVLLYGGF